MKKIKTYQLFESEYEKLVNEGFFKKFFNRDSTKSVESICNKYDIENWTLNPDGTVDVDGDVYLHRSRLSKLPLKFGKVTGYFDCSNNKLTSLEGCPNWVGRYFDCSCNELTNLGGSPNWVGGDFRCYGNKLTSLVGGPNWVGGNFSCHNNKLTSLEGCPEKVWGDLNCQRNKIYSLDHYPPILTGKLWTAYNTIHEIWEHVYNHKSNNHGVLLTLFDLHGPLRYVDGELVCNRECLDNFFEEIGVPSPPKLKNYKEV